MFKADGETGITFLHPFSKLRQREFYCEDEIA